MSEEISQPDITRQDLIAAYQPFVEKGIKNPYEIASSEPVSDLDTAYHQQQSEMKKALSLDQRIRAEIAETTVYFDAGFSDVDLLDEIASDWLINTLSEANDAHRRDLANEVKAKIKEIQTRIKELNPAYELTDWDKFDQEAWNPPWNSAPKDFYADYAYAKGPTHETVATTVEGALAEYLRGHKDADPALVRDEMEQAAKEYSESG